MLRHQCEPNQKLNQAQTSRSGPVLQVQAYLLYQELASALATDQTSFTKASAALTAVQAKRCMNKERTQLFFLLS